MAVTASKLDSGQVASGTSTNTASISPSANKLVIVGVINVVASGTPNTPTVTGASMTWTQVGTFQGVANTLRRVTFFKSYSASPGSGALTIDLAGQSQSAIAYVVVEFSNTTLTTTQFVGNDATGTLTGLTVTLGAFSNTGNATFGFVRNSSNNVITEGSGFTQLDNTTTNGAKSAEFKDTNDTTVDWTWASVSGSAIGGAIEIPLVQPSGGAFLFNFI